MNVTVHFHHALYPASYIHLFINLAVWNDSEHHESNRCSQWISDALCKNIKLQLVVRLVGSRGKFRFKHHTHNPLYWLILLTCWKTCYICIHNSSPPHCKALECCCTFKEEKLTHLETLQLDTIPVLVITAVIVIWSPWDVFNKMFQVSDSQQHQCCHH